MHGHLPFVPLEALAPRIVEELEAAQAAPVAAAVHQLAAAAAVHRPAAAVAVHQRAAAAAAAPVAAPKITFFHTTTMELVIDWSDFSMILPVAAVAAAFVRPEWLQPHRASLAAAVPAVKLDLEHVQQ